jgi:hypothetical protein
MLTYVGGSGGRRDFLAERWLLSEWMLLVIRYWSWYYTVAFDLNNPLEILLDASCRADPSLQQGHRTCQIQKFDKDGATPKAYDLVRSRQSPRPLGVGGRSALRDIVDVRFLRGGWPAGRLLTS